MNKTILTNEKAYSAYKKAALTGLSDLDSKTAAEQKETIYTAFDLPLGQSDIVD